MAKQYENKTAQRRGFLRSTAALGAGLVLTPLASGQIPKKPADDLNIALLGAGTQGQNLMNACLKTRRIRIKAVCDIWEEYNLKRVSRILEKFRQPNNAYVDYREMLDKEQDLDAVIIATPDFWHARQTIDCLNAGLHVYCERPMATTTENARRMVHAARKTGKLLQIGHHRRSNPRYIRCYEQLIKGGELLGNLQLVNAFWKISPWMRNGRLWPKKYKIEPRELVRYGYQSMDQFVNWRWHKALGIGALGSFGSDQIDVFNWFLQSHPSTAMALGNDDNAEQWPDSLVVAFNYRTEGGNIRAVHQTFSGSNALNHFEAFLGENVALIISDGLCGPSAVVAASAAWAAGKYHGNPFQDSSQMVEIIRGPGMKDFLGILTVTETHTRRPPAISDLQLSLKSDKSPLRLHLEDFFEAIHNGGKTPLNCPAQVGYETAVTVLKINEAVETGRKLEFSPDEFKI